MLAQFHELATSLGFIPRLESSDWGINPEKLSFLILLATCAALWFDISTKRITRRKLPKLQAFVQELSRERRFPELLELVTHNLPEVAKAYHANYFLSRVRNRLSSYRDPLSFHLASLNDPGDQLAKPNSIEYRFLTIAAKRLSPLLPAYTKEADAARIIIHEVLANKKSVVGGIGSQPYYAIPFYGHKFFEYQDFFCLYLESLAADSSSVLYQELRNNQSKSYDLKYNLDASNRLLYFLFYDCKTAFELAPYKAIGEAVIDELDDLHYRGTADNYNSPLLKFDDEEKWHSRVFMGIRFFDVMICEALHQDIEWHMWLYYFPEFAKRIARNIDPSAKHVDESAEFPTRYHYLLYELISCLCDWATGALHIPATQKNAIIEDENPTHENGNIPKSAMLALGLIVKEILTLDKYEQSFRIYILEIVFRGYFELRQSNKGLANHAAAMLNAVRNGGPSFRLQPGPHSETLVETFNNMDLIPYNHEAVTETRYILESDRDAWNHDAA
ncbi:MAG: hypothetical protein R3E87_24670 [Burkholderiaceae bacterium]